MSFSDSPDDTIVNFVLRTLAVTCSDAWCFVRAEPRRITHCSTEFLKLFELPETSFESGVVNIDVTDRQLQAGCQALGMQGDWFLRLFQRLQRCKDQEHLTDEYEELSVTCRPIQENDARLSGCLVLFGARGGTGAMQQAWKIARSARQQLGVLSERERQILDLVALGMTNKAIARQIRISEKTVEKHRANIMRKLRVRSIAELMQHVTYAQLLDPSKSH